MSGENEPGDDRIELPGGVDRPIMPHRYFGASEGDGPAWVIHDCPTDRLILTRRFSTDGPVRFGGQGLMLTAAAIRYEPYPDSDAVSGYGLHMAGWKRPRGIDYWSHDRVRGPRIFDGADGGYLWTVGWGAAEVPVTSLADVAARLEATEDAK